jgi:hypothetical protein
MRKFVLSAAAMTAFAALVASVPAQADMHYGPSRNGNQCYQTSPGSGRSEGFGAWTTCPQPAGTAATARRAARLTRR